MSWPPLVEFEPIALGPFEISRLPAAGAAGVAAYLAGLALSVAALRRTSLPPRLALELFAAGGVAALVASRMPGLAARFPEFLHDSSELSAALADRAALAPAALAALVVAAAFAWASRRPGEFLDALAPAVLLLSGVAAAVRLPDLRHAALVLAGSVEAGLLAARVRPRTKGRLAAFAAVLSCVLLGSAWAS